MLSKKCLQSYIKGFYNVHRKIYLDAVAIPRAIGSVNPNLSIRVCAKLAPTRPVKTTTAAVRDVFVTAHKFSLMIS